MRSSKRQLLNYNMASIFALEKAQERRVLCDVVCFCARLCLSAMVSQIDTFIIRRWITNQCNTESRCRHDRNKCSACVWFSLRMQYATECGRIADADERLLCIMRMSVF